jgi:hypothetical protein
MDNQIPYQKVTVTIEDFGTGKTQKAVFYKTTHLLFHTEDIAEGYSSGVEVTMTMKSFALEHGGEVCRIEQPSPE